MANGQIAAIWSDGTQVFSRIIPLTNNPPILTTPLPDLTVTQNTAVNVTIPTQTFSDTDPLTLSATLADGSPLPSWLTFNPSTATFSGTAPAGFDLPPLSIQVTARDTAGGTAADTFTLTLTAASATPDDDLLYGTAQADAIDGLAGNDQILGGSGNDTLAGGAGTDTLTGGTGTDRFDFRVADGGGDRIADFETGETLRIEGAPASTEQYRLRPSGPDTVLDIDTDGVGDFDLSVTLSGNANGIVNVAADPTSATAQLITITPANASYGSQNSDVLTAGSSQTTPQTVFGLRGDDLINTGTGDDLLDGGSGNDRLFGNSGRDTLLGGSGDDLLAGQFDADVLTGGAGVDQYFFSIFDANGDHITDYQYGEKIGLYFAPTDASRYTLVRNGSQSSLGIDTTGDGQADVSIRLPDNLNGTVNLSQEVISGDTVQIVTIAIPNQPPILTTPLPDLTIAQNTTVNVTIPAQTFSDTDPLTLSATLADGSPLPSWLTFNPTTATLSGTAPAGFDLPPLSIQVTARDTAGGTAADTFTLTLTAASATPGDDVLYGTAQADAIDGLAGNDQILGGSGNDTLAGGAGTDTLTGGTGTDRFDFRVADGGGDRIADFETGETLRIEGAPASTEQYRLRPSGPDTVLDIDTDGVGDFDLSVTLSGNANGIVNVAADPTSATAQLITITPANASYGSQSSDVLTAGSSQATPQTVFGLRGDDLINTGTGDDLLDGGSGNDRLFGNSGRDTLLGGSGDDLLAGQFDADVLTGGAGIDQYFFGIGDANGDHITDYTFGEKIGLYFAPTDASRYTLVRNGSQSNLGIDTTGDGQADVSIRLPDNLDGTVNLSQEVIGGDTVQIVTLTPVAPPANRDPVAAADSASTLRNTGVTVAVRTNDSDPDGDALTVTAVTAGSANGQVSIDPVSGNPRYTPVSNFVGTDQFTYTISDGRGGSASTSVTVRVATQIGTDNADTLNGTTGANFIVGLRGADQINALGGSDTVEADDGNDTLVGGAGADQLHGGAGDDTFLVTGSDLTGDTVRGGAGSDTLRLSGHTTLGATGFVMSEVETLDMAGFSFTVQTSQTLDLSGLTVVNGGLIQGHAGANALVGTAGADLMHGGGEADLVRGGAGNDTLSGGAGRDTVEGGEGEDILRLGGSDPAGDVLDGGAGTDTLQLISHTTLGTAGMALSGLEIFDMGRFNLNVQTSTLVDLSGLELVNAGAISGDGRANTLHGTRGNDTILGGGEADRLRGGLGNDSLSGDGGNDTLSGGLGNDWLQGGTGADLFVFDVMPDASHADTIAGFSANAADRIAFDPTLFSAIVSQGSSALDASEFRTTVGGNAVDADDFVVYDPVTGGLYYDADGSGAAAKVLVATVSGLTGTLDHQDFVMAVPGGF